ncbi:DNA-binding transcriptional MerR regulator [Saccharothrix tamanrassetensis]|uniref:DNA-binding transcriptional MerR regulator n=1 Tax=Saccharothrix tamanrassetensis TaxID=1051531 RepID=A0A841C8B6_9PSEU|nr:MerR family transcriptional regulator [Saccharothrix tamanrassetensis]MBB5953649.1 DNA-binding transcriptional MerR regulator [Saccharothrix tamanrassetensis]
MTDGGVPPRAEWTPRALAAMLGISPTTLRTWDQRYGLSPSIRTKGNHRRYTAADVELLRRMVVMTAGGLAPAAAAAMVLRGAAPTEVAADRRAGIGRVSAGSARRGFARAARRLDEPLMRELALGLIAEHGVVDAWRQVFQPILVDLGRKAAERGRGVEVEHVTGAGIVHALRGVPYPEREGRLTALLACAPDEQHTLPLEALAAALSERGRTWRNLGARVPPQALVDAVDKLRPTVVVVWAHRAELARRVPLALLLERFDTLPAVAGGGWQSTPVPPGVRRLGSLPEAVRLVVASTEP